MSNKPRFCLWFLSSLMLYTCAIYAYFYDLAWFDKFFKMDPITTTICLAISVLLAIANAVCGWRVFFDKTKTKFENTISYLCTSLGFIGTIIGCVIGIEIAFSGDMSSDTQRMEVFSKLPNAVLIALLTTLYGVCASVANRMQFLFLRDKNNE